mgnify:FL=1
MYQSLRIIPINAIPGLTYRIEYSFEELCVLGKEKPILCSNCSHMKKIDNKFKCDKFKLTPKKVKTLQEFLYCQHYNPPFGHSK